MYQNFDFANPKHLQWKVFCDIMLYFCRRGRENLREMKRSDFVCTTDSDGLRYIYICKDELTKNHQDDPNTASDRMYEIKGIKFPKKNCFVFHNVIFETITCPKKMSTKHLSRVDCTSVLYGCIFLLHMHFIYDQGVCIYI